MMRVRVRVESERGGLVNRKMHIQIIINNIIKNGGKEDYD